MEKIINSNLKLGIIAGGQLAKMLIHEASRWGIVSYVMDMEENCPAGEVASVFVKGSRFDFDSVYNFGKMVDLLTFEIESVNIDALLKLKSDGLKIVPDPAIIKLIQDKGLQKDFYLKNNIPTSPFKLYDSKEDIIENIKSNKLSFPFVQKLRKGGYDGRGVAVINSSMDIEDLLDGESVIEEKVDIFKEIAVIVARNEKGDVRCFPPVEMVFDKDANLVERLISPANISNEETEECTAIASKLVELLGMAGVLAVEFFISQNGKILVNEIAPRPHNSGHHTIESIVTSQYEQHLRAILNLPLGSTQIKMPAVMLNILGEKGYEGPVMYEGLVECMAIEGAKIHLYGKKITKPFRKMGHVTIISNKLEDAIFKADQVKNLIKVKSWNKKV